MAKRIGFALFAIPVFLGISWVGDYPFLVLMLLISLLIQRELINLMDMQGFRPNAALIYISGTALFAIAIFPKLAALIIFCVVIFQITVETLNKHDRQMFRLMSSLYCTVYPSATILSMVLLRNMGEPMYGFGLLLILLFIVWGNDTFAFFGGRTFGNNLMAPYISPKKTWEGFASGFLGATVGLYLALTFYPLEGVVFASTWPLILLISVFGPIGDLAASKLKRSAGAKDSSNLLPGHGGFLDRFDSLLLAGPIMYLYAIYLIL